MTTQMTTMQALIEAIQETAKTDDEALATLTYMLESRRVVLRRPAADQRVSLH